MEILKVTNVEELEALIQRVREAQEEYSTYSQKQVDEIFRRASIVLQRVN